MRDVKNDNCGKQMQTWNDKTELLITATLEQVIKMNLIKKIDKTQSESKGRICGKNMN